MINIFKKLMPKKQVDPGYMPTVTANVVITTEEQASVWDLTLCKHQNQADNNSVITCLDCNQTLN